MESTVWIIVAVVAVLILAAIIGAMMAQKKKQQNRVHASELREHASSQATGVQQREAEAKETEARSRQARAEADQKAAQAERLEAHASDEQSTAAVHREEHAESLRRADKLDPDTTERPADSHPDQPVTPATGQADDADPQRYDAEGHPLGPDGRRTGVDPNSGTHRP